MYKEYAELKQAISILEKKQEELRISILTDLNKRKLIKDENEFGIFTKCFKKQFTYSKKLQKEEESLKIQKIDEQMNGKAKVEESEYVMYKSL